MPQRLDTGVAKRRDGLDRRQLLKAGAWAAPVIVLAAAVPAHASSTESPFGTTPGTQGSIPLEKLTLQVYGISNLDDDGASGPLQWDGAQIRYNGQWDDAVGTVAYTIVATGPGGYQKVLVQGATTLVVYDGIAWSKDETPDWPTVSIFAPQPTAPGTYTVTLTVYAAGSPIQTKSTSAQITV